MNEAYEHLVKSAEILAENAQKKYNDGLETAYIALLTGYGDWYIGNGSGTGHNWYAVTDALHKKHKEEPFSGYDQGFQKNLMILADSFRSLTGLEILLKYFFYQLRLEKEDKAEFTIDKTELAEQIRNNMVKEQENLKKDPQYWQQISKIQEYAMKHFEVEL